MKLTNTSDTQRATHCTSYVTCSKRVLKKSVRVEKTSTQNGHSNASWRFGRLSNRVYHFIQERRSLPPYRCKIQDAKVSLLLRFLLGVDLDHVVNTQNCDGRFRRESKTLDLTDCWFHHTRFQIVANCAF